MKRISILLVAIIGLSSCYTKRQCELRCSARKIHDSVNVRDSIAWRIKDSTVFHEAKIGPEVAVKSPCDSFGQMKVFDVKETKNGITTELKSDGKTVTASCKEEAYLILLKGVIRQRDAWHNAFRQVVYKAPCDKDHVNGWYRFSSWFTIIVLISMAIYVAFKIGTKKITWLTRIWP